MTGRTLITGATGFVGRQVVARLTELDVPMRFVVRSEKQESVGRAFPQAKLTLSDDLFGEPADWWKAVCEDVDTIIHLAWYAEPGKYLQSDKNLDCLLGTLAMARGAAAAGVQRFVGVGTCFEYEFQEVALSVTSPLRPLTPYAGAKAATFFALSQFLPAHGCSFAWCRLFYLYGEGEDPRRLVPYLHQQLSKGEPAALTSGTQVRDFLDVKEAGRQIAKFALNEVEGAINVCSGVPITVRELAEQIAEEYGRSDLLQFGARPDNLMDPPIVLGVPGPKGDE